MPSLGAPNSGPLPASVVISEIHYHPPDILLGTTRVDDTAFEFVEVTNVGGTPMALHDPARPTNTWHLGGTIEFTFPRDLVLPPGGSLVVVNFDPERNPQALAGFRSALGVAAGVRLLGPLEGRLQNSGGAWNCSARTSLRTRRMGRRSWCRRSAWIGSCIPMRALALGGGWFGPFPPAGSLRGTRFRRAGLGGVGSEPGGASSAGSRLRRRSSSGCLGGSALPGSPGFNRLPGDADDDFSSNLEEYIAGTDPSDPLDVLAWEGVAPGPNGFELRFRARVGRAYRIEVAGQVPGEPWRRLQDVPVAARDEVVTVLDTEAGEGTAPRFYRIVVPAMP